METRSDLSLSLNTYKPNASEIVVQFAKKVYDITALGAWTIMATGLNFGWIYPIAGLISGNQELQRFVSIFPVESAVTLPLFTITLIWFWSWILDKVIANMLTREAMISRFKRWRDWQSPRKLLLVSDYPIASLLPMYNDYPWIRFYFSGLVLPINIDKIQEKLSELLLYYPVELVQEHLEKIVIHDFWSRSTDGEETNDMSLFKKLPDPIRKTLEEAKKNIKSSGYSWSNYWWQATRGLKNIHIAPWNDSWLEECMHHELAHMIFLHWLIRRFSNDWKREFGEHQLDQTEYVSHPMMWTEINYWVIDIDEDMATIAEKLFSQEWWEILINSTLLNQKNWKRPWILRNKINKLIWFYEKQSKWFMDMEFFKKIQEWEIKCWDDAKKYFSHKKTTSW